MKEFSDWMVRLGVKLDSIISDVSDIKVTLSQQEEHLKNHIRRTDLLEDSFKPVQKTVLQVEGIGKFLAVMGVGSVLFYVIAKLL